jgi:hypothetical protein
MTQISQLRKLGAELLANGKIEGHEIELLRMHFAADGKVDRQEAEFLLELYQQTKNIAPSFERFFCSTLKKYLLSDRVLDRDKAIWLRRVIFFDGAVRDREKKLLRELRGEASAICDEAQALFEDCGI